MTELNEILFFCFFVYVCVVHLQVIANMNAAYKQEKKKNSKRRTQNTPPTTLKMSPYIKTEPLFGVVDSPPAKKVKESLYLSFPVETVLATEQNSSEDVKAELTYRLAEPDVH